MQRKSSSVSRNRIVVREENPITANIPPTLPVQNRLGVTYRYVKTGAGTATIKWKDLFGLIVVAATTTTGYGLFDAVKLRKIKAYMLPLVNTSSTGISISPLKFRVFGGSAAGFFGSDRMMSAYPTAHGAKLSFKPSPPSDDWVTQITSDSILDVLGPLGVIVDIELSGQIAGISSSANTAVSTTGATVGVFYGNYADASGTQLLQNQASINNALVWA